MAGIDEDRTTDERLRRVEEAHAALLARTAALEAENRALRADGSGAPSPVPLAPPTTAMTTTEPARGPAVGRRSMLRAGLAAAGAAATGAVLLDGAPVAAADGDALRLGQDNDATEATTLTVGSEAASGLRVIGGAPVELPSTDQVSIPREGAAIVTESGSGMGTGVLAVTDTGIGVRAHARMGYALFADTVRGNALRAQAHGDGIGVRTSTHMGNAVHATSTSGETVWAESQHGDAVLAWSHGGRGIVAVTDDPDSPALWARSNFGGGVSAQAVRWDLKVGRPDRTDPAEDTFAHTEREIVGGPDGTLWLCTEGGTPGTWRTLGGAGGAGAFYVLPAPVRIYDSRSGTSPAVGPKTRLEADEVRTLDVNARGPVVPEDATAALVTVLLVNAAAGLGNFTLWAGGVAKPQANTLVWGGNAGRFTTSAVTALTAGRVRVHANLTTNVVLDVVGFYR